MKCQNCGCDNSKGASRCECGSTLTARKRVSKATKVAPRRGGRMARASAAR